MFKQIRNFKWFTLVELIVVITILAILSTVWFVAYVDYLKGARDGSRLQQLWEIHNALNLYATRSKLPLPNDWVSVVSWGAQVGVQWFANTAILDEIKYSDWWKDPKTKDFFTYFVSKNRKSAQLLAFFEEDQALTISSRTYADYGDLYPYVYGENLGLLIDSSTQTPIQELEQYAWWGTFDILTQTGSYTSFLNNTESITGSWELLLGMVPNTDCDKLQSFVPGLKSGIYKINPTGTEQINVYCDMDIDNGWWTLIARTSLNGEWNFGWLESLWNVYDNDSSYSFGSEVKNIRFDEIMVAVYDTEKEIEWALKFDIDSSFFNSQMVSPDTSTKEQTSNCQIIHNLNYVTNNCNAFRYWGAFAYNLWYPFERYSSWHATPFKVNFLQSTENSLPAAWSTSFQSKQGMLFVR